MDFRFPEFPAPRDGGAEPAPRRSRTENSEFAELLDRSIDAPREKPRDLAAGKQAGERPHVEPASDNGPHPVEASRHADLAEPTTAPDVAVVNAANEQPVEPPAPAATDSAIEQSAPQPPAPETKVAAILPQPAVAQTVVPAPAIGAVGPIASGASTTPPQDVVPVQSESAAPVVSPTAASASAEQPEFALELAAATSRPAETAATRQKPAPKASAAPATNDPQIRHEALPTISVVAIPATEPAQDSPTRDPRNPAANAAGTIAAQANAPAINLPGTAPQPAAEKTDAAQVVALVRPTALSADRAAGSNDPAIRAPVPAGLALQDAVIDLKPATAEQKTEAPSRPFGAVAPGLNIAAQIAAQQTPDQANAAERIAQLAAGKEIEPAAKAGGAPAEQSRTAEAAPPPPRADQLGQVDSAAPRHATNDVAAVVAAARSGRATAPPVVAQVAAHVAQAAIDGNDRISIRLSPAELGRIDVKLEFGPEGRVQAVFAADRAQTMELLQRDARELERALQDAGLRADSGSLSFNLRGDSRNGGHDDGSGRNGGDKAATDLGNPQLQAYGTGGAAPGRLDIRI